MRDIEQQLAGIETKDDLKVGHIALLPVQKELVDAIFAPPGRTFNEEVRRRNTAIDVVKRYCGI